MSELDREALERQVASGEMDELAARLRYLAARLVRQMGPYAAEKSDDFFVCRLAADSLQNAAGRKPDLSIPNPAFEAAQKAGDAIGGKHRSRAAKAARSAAPKDPFTEYLRSLVATYPGLRAVDVRAELSRQIGKDLPGELKIRELTPLKAIRYSVEGEFREMKREAFTNTLDRIRRGI